MDNGLDYFFGVLLNNWIVFTLHEMQHEIVHGNSCRVLQLAFHEVEVEVINKNSAHYFLFLLRIPIEFSILKVLLMLRFIILFKTFNWVRLFYEVHSVA